jgi:hypothetical protein
LDEDDIRLDYVATGTFAEHDINWRIEHDAAAGRAHVLNEQELDVLRDHLVRRRGRGDHAQLSIHELVAPIHGLRETFVVLVGKWDA